MSDAAPAVVVPINENIPRAEKTIPAQPTVAAPEPIPARRRNGRWFPAFCALVALIAAGIALAAPALRPELAAVATDLLGRPNLISRLLTPGDAAGSEASKEIMQRVATQVADYNSRLAQLAADQQTAAADLARAIAEFRATAGAGSALANSVAELERQAKELTAATSVLDARTRSAGLLGLALRLRRDLDAGMPIEGDVAALAATGPYPPTVETALRELQSLRDGAPTMRDLADGFDRVIAHLTAHAEPDVSWAARGWTRLTSLFSRASAPNYAEFTQRLRALADAGRFAEAAKEIMASEHADVGRSWAARVHARAVAVTATQTLLSYSLAVYQNAFAAGSR